MKIDLWSIEDSNGTRSGSRLESVSNTETEAQLEDLLVASPDMLIPGLTLVGRQLPTAGGPLDLLGIDQDGRAVVFELKRGTLTRDAVAQVVDYGSDLASTDPEGFARAVEESSGRGGIAKFEDFSDWYDQEFPNGPGPVAEAPKMILVGLGADERARRMTEFLAASGVDIQLLTFHAFEVDGRLLLARQTETQAVARPALDRAATKEGNRQSLHQTAASLGVLDLLEQARDFLQVRIPGYCWPGKTAYSFSLPGRTSDGNPSLHGYATLYTDPKQAGRLNLVFPARAVEAAGADAVEAFSKAVPTSVRDKSSYSALELLLDSDNWGDVQEPLGTLIASVVEGWKAKAEA